MAEGTGKNEDNSGGSWWGSWVTTAREKTEKAFEMMSQDIAEFTTTMQTDTKKVVEKTKETIQQQSSEGGVNSGSGGMKDKMAASFHHLMEGITKVLTVEAEDANPTAGHSGSGQVQHPATGIFDRAKMPKSRVEARLRAIQVDTGTYLSEPSGPPEQYAEWLKTFNLDAHKGEVSDLLVSMVEVRSLYTSLVPSEVSHQEFWRRYFYKLHQMDRDEARKQALMQRAERANNKEDSISWDEEWSGDEESGSPEASRQKTKPSSNTDASSTQKEATEDLKSRLNPDIQDDQNTPKGQQKNEAEDKHIGSDSEQQSKSCPSDEISVSSPSSDDTQSNVKHKDSNETEPISKPESNTMTDPSGKSEPETKTEDKEKDSAESSPSDPEVVVVKCNTDNHEGAEGTEASVGDTVEAGDKEREAEEGIKTKVRGDMVVVTEKDRVSPTSESSGTKESSTEDWEKDFDVDITPEDLAAASELAQKMNSSATDYTKIAEGAEDDWESWE